MISQLSPFIKRCARNTCSCVNKIESLVGNPTLEFEYRKALKEYHNCFGLSKYIVCEEEYENIRIVRTTFGIKDDK
jgi:hypothetical protein